MKHLFKRFLEFEKKEENVEGVEHVKAKARDFVASKST
jgi:hypothetical protein